MTSPIDIFAAISERLGHLGCHEPAARATEAIEVQIATLGRARLVSQNDAYCDTAETILELLEGLPDGCGTDSVWEALRADLGEDDDLDPDDEGQPDSLQERQDFAGDDDWREYQVEAYDPFDGE